MSELVGFDFLTIRKSLESIIIKNLSENYSPRRINSLERELKSKRESVRSNPLINKYMRAGSVRNVSNVNLHIQKINSSNSLLEYKAPSGITLSDSVIIDMPVLDPERVLHGDNYNYFKINENGIVDLVINDKDDNKVVYINQGETFLGDAFLGEKKFK